MAATDRHSLGPYGHGNHAVRSGGTHVHTQNPRHFYSHGVLYAGKLARSREFPSLRSKIAAASRAAEAASTSATILPHDSAPSLRPLSPQETFNIQHRTSKGLSFGTLVGGWTLNVDCFSLVQCPFVTWLLFVQNPCPLCRAVAQRRRVAAPKCSVGGSVFSFSCVSCTSWLKTQLSFPAGVHPNQCYIFKP